jgi:hypothetical protein
LTLTCPSCGNSQNFLVKTLQMHVVHLEDSRVEVSEESRPAVFEVLCDECETAQGSAADARRALSSKRTSLALVLGRSLISGFFGGVPGTR